MARDDEAHLPDRGVADTDGATLRRRDLLIGGALLAASGIAFARLPRTHDALIGQHKLEDLVPKTIGKWRFETTSGLVLPPSDQLADRVYSQLLTRQYAAADGSAVMLLIAYSAAQDGVIQIHRPEVCYPASGFALVENEPRDIRLSSRIELRTRFIVAQQELRREQLMYWTRLGSYFPDAWAGQRLAVIRENLAGVIPDGVLIRMSSVGNEDARELLDAFAVEMYRSVGPVMKQVMAGAAAVAAGRG